MFEFLKRSFEESCIDFYKNVNDVKYAYIKDRTKDRVNYHYFVIYHEYLSKWGSNEHGLINELENLLINRRYNLLDSNLEGVTQIKVKNFNQIDKHIFSGDLIIYSSFTASCYAIPFKNDDVDYHQLDVFSENSKKNIGLIRERIKTSKLKNFHYNIGDYTKSDVNLLYIEDLCTNEVIEKIKGHLENAHFDSIQSLPQLHNIIIGNQRSLVPLLNQTTKISLCTDALLSGQFLAICNGMPSCLIGPVNFNSFITTSKSEHYLVGLFEKLIKIVAIFIGILTMGLAASLLSFNPELLPYVLITNVINARKGVFLNVHLELILAEFILHAFRILAVQKLSSLSKPIIIVFGILTGQLAVSSGIIGQDVLILAIISFGGIYLASNNIGFTSSLYFFRIFIFIASILFGLVGFALSSIFTLVFFISQESFNIPYLSPLAPFNLKKLYQSILPKTYFPRQNRIKNDLSEVD